MFPAQYGQVQNRSLLGEFATSNYNTRAGQYKVMQLSTRKLFNLINLIMVFNLF